MLTCWPGPSVITVGEEFASILGGVVRINTSRFGEVEISQDDILEFSEGLLGFGQLRRFVVLDDPNDEIFAWLQSCEN